MRVSAPATSANLGAGYDVLAVALSQPADIVEVEAEEGEGVDIMVRGEWADKVPSNPHDNSAGRAAIRLLQETGVKAKVRITIDKRIPVSSGLGSSGASAAAVVYALNKILGLGLRAEELVRIAGYGEEAAAGTVHYDNVAAAILGWFVIVRSDGENLEAVSIRPPGNRVFFSVAVPLLEPVHGKTGKARSLVPRTVKLEEAVWNIASASLLVAGASRGDPALIGAGMSDAIAEPRRKSLVPGYCEVRRNALEAGALGVAISGAGPSMIAVSESARVAERVSRAMQEAFRKTGVEARSFVSPPGPGVRPLE